MELQVHSSPVIWVVTSSNCQELLFTTLVLLLLRINKRLVPRQLVAKELVARVLVARELVSRKLNQYVFLFE